MRGDLSFVGWNVEVKLGYIHCCAGLRKSKSYSISPDGAFVSAELDYVEKCPICGHTVAQITRVDLENNVSICRKTNEKARKLFEKLKTSILFEREKCSSMLKVHSKFYLNYNEFGVKKKCYSNLSTLKMGLFENKELLKEEKPEFLEMLAFPV